MKQTRVLELHFEITAGDGDEECDVVLMSANPKSGRGCPFCEEGESSLDHVSEEEFCDAHAVEQVAEDIGPTQLLVDAGFVLAALLPGRLTMWGRYWWGDDLDGAGARFVPHRVHFHRANFL